MLRKYRMTVVLLVACYAGFLATGVHAQVTFDWVTVGNPGNAADQDYGAGTFGAVADTYRISKFEVTNDQYAEFLNAVAATDSFPGTDPNLYNSSMDITQGGSSGSFTYTVNTGFGPNPVNYVSFYDAMRFVNWLENGQTGSGTESGVYTISDGLSETRAASATYFIPSEDEWYKAAYHQPAAQGGPLDDYWLYPTQSDSAPSCVAPPGPANSANCGLAVGDTTDVGAYTNTTNFYGTFDQGGNVWEWNEAVISSSFRGLRGGSWVNNSSSLAASNRIDVNPTVENNIIGFRVASIPEPSTGLLGVLGMLGLTQRRRRSS